MNMKLVSLAVMACCLAGGSAFAKSGALDKTDMHAFYHDSEMKQMKTGDEFSSAVHGLSSEKLKSLSDACHEDANGEHKHKDFCAALDQASGVKAGEPNTGSPVDSDSSSD